MGRLMEVAVKKVRAIGAAFCWARTATKMTKRAVIKVIRGYMRAFMGELQQR